MANGSSTPSTLDHGEVKVKRPGNPRNGRRLHGIPKAGPLYVNGIKTPKGNVLKAVSKMYRSAERSRAYLPGLPGPFEILNGADLDDLHAICHGCGSGIDRGVLITRERATGKVWHMGSSTCRPVATTS